MLLNGERPPDTDLEQQTLQSAGERRTRKQEACLLTQCEKGMCYKKHGLQTSGLLTNPVLCVCVMKRILTKPITLSEIIDARKCTYNPFLECDNSLMTPEFYLLSVLFLRCQPLIFLSLKMRTHTNLFHFFAIEKLKTSHFTRALNVIIYYFTGGREI